MIGLCLWITSEALEAEKANLAHEGTALPSYPTALWCWVMLLCLEMAGTRTDSPGQGRGKGGGAGWVQAVHML